MSCFNYTANSKLQERSGEYDEYVSYQVHIDTYHTAVAVLLLCEG